MRRSMTCALTALFLGSAGAAFAQGSMPGSPSPSAYVMAAGQGDQFEIQEGQLAESMGASPKVKHFGREMVKDHTKSTKMVMMAAQKSGLPPAPPPPLRPDQRQMVATLQASSGPDFDRVYLQQQLQAHQEALQLQQGYAQNGSDSNLKMAASNIVPVVQKHLDMLQSMQSRMER